MMQNYKPNYIPDSPIRWDTCNTCNNSHINSICKKPDCTNNDKKKPCCSYCDHSHSQGNPIECQGDQYQSQGDLTESQGDLTESQGDLTQEQGDQSASIGDQSAVQGDQTQEQTQSQGDLTESQGDQMQSQGDLSESLGDLSAIQGDLTQEQGDQSASIGDQSAVQGDQSQTLGDLSESQGDLAQSQGNQSQTQGDLSESLGDLIESQGDLTESQGDQSQSQGDLSESLGDQSASQGDQSQTQGDLSESLGDLIESQGDLTESQGDQSQSQGDLSSVQGDQSQTQGDSSEVQGDQTETLGDQTQIQEGETQGDQTQGDQTQSQTQGELSQDQDQTQGDQFQNMTGHGGQSLGDQILTSSPNISTPVNVSGVNFNVTLSCNGEKNCHKHDCHNPCSCRNAIANLLRTIIALQQPITDDEASMITFAYGVASQPSVTGTLVSVTKDCTFGVAPASDTPTIYIDTERLEGVTVTSTTAETNIFAQLLAYLQTPVLPERPDQKKPCECCTDTTAAALDAFRIAGSNVRITTESTVFTGYIYKINNGIVYLVDDLTAPAAIYAIPICKIISFEEYEEEVTEDE